MSTTKNQESTLEQMQANIMAGDFEPGKDAVSGVIRHVFAAMRAIEGGSRCIVPHRQGDADPFLGNAALVGTHNSSSYFPSQNSFQQS